ncbi:RsmB/NOP family class I SAM-dependent RNA methyltransferase [Parvibaculum sp.]|uniref:RsmB/NOP family class I SAM-dependent RNA methyltransferase n=1 Tax=Parvibaculum sp. TaxID=2024848 RepID=UPI001D62F7A1|nr:RsmB/NOP family class I SAM-dependent RNA methyltransferase [Parvibaculum sp.]MBX3491016.1 RsmB/NOP family class I SAM-dependent RNA methyltransferase [Parvibaculum sp.]MCW5728835.1 RsmB/NOP family class I SAM-dependent RNA methyltransferase [Parvibaculum sp.]
MTPGARLQSAIGILTGIFETRQPADRAFDAWARSSRFAGSKDRAAVSEIVFSVLRHRAQLAAATGSDAPQLLAFAAIALLQGEGADAAAARADGTPHAPSPLTDDETAALRAAALPGPDAPPWVRLNYPEWLHPEFEAALGNSLEAEMAALMERAPTDLRVNALKATRDRAMALLADENVETEPTPLSPWGLRLTGRANILGLASFRDGVIELQDEGSQLACLATGVTPGEQVVDLCAGGGGKSLALAAMMRNRGQVHACDTDARRLGKLMPRAQRAGIRNIQTRTLGRFAPGAADADLADLEARMDCVLVDAPCSGTGAWRRNPDARWRIDPETLAGYRAAQSEVLARAARLLRPGGRLVYVTCSMLPSENEKQVEAFQAAHTDFAAMPWRSLWPADIAPPPHANDGAYLRLTPGSAGTDGFFIAILRREG